ncbi:hypothetical protein DL98DRAFT_661354 [Cadophora sp. DSE1049]|nr:hypothetical protein DL98DRAFT_661354 [Cadophora sp. DSE1049]
MVMTSLTKLAEVYSHPTGKDAALDHKVLSTKKSRKSGLTPSFLLATGSNASHNNTEKYQRGRFYDFSAAELQAAESLAPYHSPIDRQFLTDSTTTRNLGPIHPAFAKEKWEQPLPKHPALFPLGNGRLLDSNIIP